MSTNRATGHQFGKAGTSLLQVLQSEFQEHAGQVRLDHSIEVLYEYSQARSTVLMLL